MPAPPDSPSSPGPPSRRALAELIAMQLGQRDESESAELRARLTEALDAATDVELDRFLERIRTTGQSWGFHPPDPVARRLARVVQRVVFEPGSTLEGAAELRALDGRPALFLSNHLSFADANVFEQLLAEAGLEEVAERLAVIVGPKVYTRSLRRLASLCFGTVKIPQSSSRASGEARMPTRDVARIAGEMLQAAHERLKAGDHLLVFVEGTRSRSGVMQRALAGVARYLELPGLVVFPVGIWGSERLVPLADVETLHRTRVHARIGAGLDAEVLRGRCGRNRSLLMDAIGFLIADLLPPEYRGVYAGNDPERAAAQALAEDLL